MIAKAVRGLFVVAVLVLAGAVGGHAQDAAGWLELAVDEENLRAAPNGARIAVVRRGARLAAVGEEGRWSEVVLTGYVPADRLRADDRDGPGHAIAAGGEEILDRPAGRVIGRGDGGMLVETLDEREGWRRIRRTAWIWTASVEPAAAPEASDEPSAPEERATADAGTPPMTPAAPEDPPAGEVSGPLVLLDAPGGDTVAIIMDPARLRLVEVEGDWRRVQADGWTVAAIDDRGEGGDPTPAVVRESPERFHGRTVTWTVEYLSLQRADASRTDFEAGEWYVLARNPEGYPGFVYLVVNEEMRRQARGLVPLQRITARGRLRTARSEQTGHPVIEVQSFRP